MASNEGNKPAHPTSYGVLLFPGFQALDAFGPLDALNSLARRRKINLSVIAATLDPVSTKPKEPAVGSDFAQAVVPTHTFDNHPPLDVLIVPGGIGTRYPEISTAVEFIKKVYPSLQYLLTVCTGSKVVAETGLLDGRKATTNKSRFGAIAAEFPAVNWVHKARWVVDGNIWTASGVSAGMDLIFAFIEHVYDADFAKTLENHLEYDRHTDASWDPFAELYPYPA